MKVCTELSDALQKYSDVFPDELPDELPPNHELDFDTKIRVDAPPRVRLVFRLSTEELAKLKRQLKELVVR